MPEVRSRAYLEIIATDRATRVLGGLEGSFRRFGSQLLGLVGLGGGLYGLQRATKACISAAMAQEKAEIELAAALGETDLIARKSVETYKTFASEMQRQTIYAEDLILSQMAYAKNLGVSEDKLKEATKAAIGLAAGYRIDLASAMMLVGRASQGQTQTLTRYGIVLDDSLSAQEKFNKLLEIGAGKFALAEAETKTAAGQIQQFKNDVDDAAEAVGGPLSRAMGRILSDLRKIAEEIKKGPFTESWREEQRLLAERRQRIPEIIPFPEPWRRMVEPTVPTIPEIPTKPGPWREQFPALEEIEKVDWKLARSAAELEIQLREGTGPAIEETTNDWYKFTDAAKSFEAAMEAAGEDWGKIIEDKKKAADELAEKWRQVGTVIESSLTSAFDRIIWEAQSWKDAMLDVVRAVMRELMRVWLIEPLVSGITGGVEKAIFTRAVTAHSGGVVGQTSFPERTVPTGLFAEAPRLHGGLMADEFPAILQSGERIIPRGGAATTVNIINQSGIPLSGQATSRFDAGEMIIDVFIDNVMRHGQAYDAIRMVSKQI